MSSRDTVLSIQSISALDRFPKRHRSKTGITRNGREITEKKTDFLKAMKNSDKKCAV